MPASRPEYLEGCLRSSFLKTWTEDSEVNVGRRQFHKREVLNKKSDLDVVWPLGFSIAQFWCRRISPCLCISPCSCISPPKCPCETDTPGGLSTGFYGITMSRILKQCQKP